MNLDLLDRTPPELSPEPRSRLAGPATAVGVAVAAGIVLRFVSVPPLWLDEAQSVAIARLPPAAMFDALRQDGAPPLYYLLLHGWMALFGEGDLAVRALSGVFAVAALPLFYLLGQRLGGTPRLGLLTLLLGAVNPWVVRYASEARMYSLVMLLATAAALAVHRLRERPGPGPAALFAACAALLLYTHYWSLFLLAALGAVLAWWVVRGPRRAGLAGLGALAAAGVVYLPWVPSLLFQSAHTGTPWTGRPRPVPVVLTLLRDWSTGSHAPVLFLVPAVAALLVCGAVRAERWIAAVAGGALLLAFAACVLQPAAYSTRYTAVVVPLVLVLVAVGLTTLPPGWTGWAAAGLAVLWLVASVGVATTPRSQAAQLAAVIDRDAGRGDLVAYCPDQLGPSVSRLVDAPVRQVVYPTGGTPARVDWVDYARRNAMASPAVFATRLVRHTRIGAQIWLVRRDGMRTFGRSCRRITATLTGVLGPPTTAVASGAEFGERATLLRWTR
ncbi:MAG TPA: glycosyltransferase family 39 protein [Mycobacteriales bacterium]